MTIHNMNEIISKFNKYGRIAACPIRSFVRRQNRLTKRQKYALDKYWSMIGVNFIKQPLEYTLLFGREAPVTLEIGFGMGTSLLEMAKSCPEKNFLGIEVYSPGIGTCMAKAYENGIKNLRILYHDAIEVMQEMIPENSLNVVQLFFPDPWPKQRHNKRRIVQTAFSQLVKRKLKIGGILHIATDWQPYAKYILKIISSLDGYKNQSMNNDYVVRPKSRPITKFEYRGRSLGHDVWELIFEKIQ